MKLSIDTYLVDIMWRDIGSIGGYCCKDRCVTMSIDTYFIDQYVQRSSDRYVSIIVV